MSSWINPQAKILPENALVCAMTFTEKLLNGLVH